LLVARESQQISSSFAGAMETAALVLICLAHLGHGWRVQVRSAEAQGFQNPAAGWQPSAQHASSAISTGSRHRQTAPKLVVAEKKIKTEVRGKENKKRKINLSRRKLAQLAELPEDADEVANMSRLTDLPDFNGPNFLMKQAYRLRKAVPKIDNKKLNAKVKELKYAAQQIQAYYSGVSKALKLQVKTFDKIMRNLTPFEAELARLTWEASVRDGGQTIEQVKKKLDLLRRSIIRVGKNGTEKASKASSIDEAKKITVETCEAVEKTLMDQRDAHIGFLQMVNKLRRLPQPVQGEPMLVLVGMPNVGKSSLISATSTGNPEINSYPFTTRRLKMGHVIGHSGARYQIMDTPGMLSRPEEDRNPMEGLTLASVEYLPSSVVFVMDMSGMSGAQSSPELQLRVREQVRALYPTRAWLDVRTKADLPLAEGVDPSMFPEGTLEVSVVDDTNIELLKRKLAVLAGGKMETGDDEGSIEMHHFEMDD